MKKNLINTIISLATGIIIGSALINTPKEAPVAPVNIEIEAQHTFLKRFINKNDYCFICGEELYNYESNLCLYCSDWIEGYNEGVKDTIEKYGITVEDL